MNIDLSKYEYTHELMLDDQLFHVREMIPYEEKERMAQDYVSTAMIFDDENGLAYEGYNADLLRSFLILVHYTDLELAEFDTAEGRYTAYDAIATHGLWDKIMEIVNRDMMDVDSICVHLEAAAHRRFEKQHSLEYLARKTFASFLGTEDLTQAIAKAEGINSKLIDLFSAVQQGGKHSEVEGISFAKKSNI